MYSHRSDLASKVLSLQGKRSLKSAYRKFLGSYWLFIPDAYPGEQLSVLSQ